MNTTIKTIRNIAVSNLVVLGLAACSSAPAPWTQVDDSPWGVKYKAEAETLSNDVESMSDPVLLGGSETVVMPETITPEVAVESVAIEPVVVESAVVEPAVTEAAVIETAAIETVAESQSTEQELLSLPAGDYAVQVYAATSIDSVEKFKDAKAVYELKTVATNRSGSIMYVLVDIHSDRASANAAATDLASRTGAKPWVRSLAGLQKIIVQ
jgi:septal ring-binding cell division protein DamX